MKISLDLPSMFRIMENITKMFVGFLLSFFLASKVAELILSVDHLCTKIVVIPGPSCSLCVDRPQVWNRFPMEMRNASMTRSLQEQSKDIPVRRDRSGDWPMRMLPNLI